jgi:HlyD family secretion protein
MSAVRRRAGLAGAALAALLLAWWLLRPPAVAVEIGEVSRGPLRVTVDEEGETRVRKRFVVAAPTAGRLLRIELDEGDAAPAGAVVARLEPAPLDPRDEAAARARLQAAEAQKSAAQARVALAEASLAQARRDALRAEKLREAGAASAESLELARLKRTEAEQELEAGRFSAEAADFEVAAARAALIATRTPPPRAGAARAAGAADIGCAGASPCLDVRAPVAGTVLRVREESERIVPAGAPLLELGDPSDLEIVVDVLSADAVSIKAGAEIEIEDWGGDHPLRAKVRRVEPAGFTKISALGVEEQRVNVIGDFVDSPGALGDGYRVEARIVVWQAPDVVRVPGSALFRRGDAWNVFVVQRGAARLRPVEVGRRGTLESEVRAGLEPGERVVLHPSDRVQDGARVAGTVLRN